MAKSNLTELFRKLDEFERMTPHIYQEYQNWRLETDLEFIELRGEIKPIKYVSYIEYFEWRLGIEELNRIQIEQSDIEYTEYEEIT